MHRARFANMMILVPSSFAILMVVLAADAQAPGKNDSLSNSNEHGRSVENLAASHPESGGHDNSHHEESQSIIPGFLQVDRT